TPRSCCPGGVSDCCGREDDNDEDAAAAAAAAAASDPRRFASLGRLVRLRRPNTHGTLARVHRSHTMRPSGSFVCWTVHLSFWSRHRSHDDRIDCRGTVGVGWLSAWNIVEVKVKKGECLRME